MGLLLCHIWPLLHQKELTRGPLPQTENRNKTDKPYFDWKFRGANAKLSKSTGQSGKFINGTESNSDQIYSKGGH